MLHFSSVYIGQRVRSSLQRIVPVAQHQRFWRLVKRLKEGQFEIPGLNVEKLEGKNKVYSARLNREMRLIFSIRNDASGTALLIHELDHHDQAYQRAERSLFLTGDLEIAEEEPQCARDLQVESESLRTDYANTFLGQLFEVPQYLLREPDRYLQYEENLDRYLLLNEEQEEVLNWKDRSILIQGPAGTGKTTIALFSALKRYEENPHDTIYLFTYHEELACVCRAYMVNLLGAHKNKENGAGINVLSYLDFCRNHLRRGLRAENRRLLNKEQSVALLEQIIQQKPRWSRRFSAPEFWSLLYSIFKGRFLPGEDKLPVTKQDYERIFKGYGKIPEDFEETLEIFWLYQAKLSANKFIDESDLIRLSYESLKQNALLAEADRAFWLVIDEVQDFTELEWKSILLFWENHCKLPNGLVSYPFFSGDTNQNISRSGFRWQELESYLANILRKKHRPNSLRKVFLHSNYRNTAQIYGLSSFIRKCAGESGDLGLAPEIQGPLPLLSIIEENEVLQLLKEEAEKPQKERPLVVLVEDEISLSNLRRSLPETNNAVFLLSLKQSKGFEFEDVIIYRAFSLSTGSDIESADLLRYFDLWYMGISRARRNLLLLQSPADHQALKELLSNKYSQFEELVVSKDWKTACTQFLGSRENNALDFNIIFLQRQTARECFDEYMRLPETPSDNEEVWKKRENLKNKAIALWQSCHDYSALGNAFIQLQEYEKAIPYLKRSGKIEDAAKCLKACGRFMEAASDFESVGMNFEAAECYEEIAEYARAAQLYEKALDWVAAAKTYKIWFLSSADSTKSVEKPEDDDRLRAAGIFQLISDYSSAAEIYLNLNRRSEAAECFQKAGKHEMAVELYEELGKLLDAAQSAKQSGQVRKAAELFLMCGNALEAAESLSQENQHERAAELYAQAGAYEKSASAYEKAAMYEHAAFMYEKLGDFSKALLLAGKNESLKARCLKRLGNYHEAGEIFRKMGELPEAANCFEKAEDYHTAAELYLSSKNYFGAAAHCLVRTGRVLEAAQIYLHMGQITTAYEIAAGRQSHFSKAEAEQNFRKLLNACLAENKIAAAAQLFELKKDYRSAAEKFKECMMLEKAAECLEKCGQAKESAGLFEQTGNLLRAAELYKSSKNWKEAAGCLEQLKNWEEAKLLYERCHDHEGVRRCKSALDWLS